MNYRHFTIEERCCLREYYVKGKSYREIAKLLGRNVNWFSFPNGKGVKKQFQRRWDKAIDYNLQVYAFSTYCTQNLVTVHNFYKVYADCIEIGNSIYKK